jgi:hypothetical protein
VKNTIYVRKGKMIFEKNLVLDLDGGMSWELHNSSIANMGANEE